MKKSIALAAALLVANLFCGPAQAFIIRVVEPDNYAVGTNLTNVEPGVTLSWIGQEAGLDYYNPTRDDVYAVRFDWGIGSTNYFGDRYGDAWTGVEDLPDCLRGSIYACRFGWYGIEIAFSSPTDFFQFSADFISWIPILLAFDAADNILGCSESGDWSWNLEGCSAQIVSRYPSNIDSSGTMSIHRSQRDIARVVIGGDGGPAWISQFAYSVPEPGTLALLSLGLAGLGFARRKKLS